MNLTYEQCLEIVKKNDNFYEKIDIIDGYQISTFNYILSIYEYFKKPLENSTTTAFELRGLSFLHNENNHKRFLMLHKFFNLNENDDYLLSKLKNNKIIQIQEKLDGSMIRFIKLPNGRIVAKTKVGFSNMQTKLANEIICQNEKLHSFVEDSLNNNLAAIFELCSPLNKIVLNYNNTSLKLLQIRDETLGNYLDLYNHPLVLKHKIELTENHPLCTFDELLEKQLKEENKEGYVCTLDNGVKFKLKTKWYFDRHELMDKTSFENVLIEMILKEELDDAISLLDKDNERRIYAEKIQIFLSHHLSKLINESKTLISFYNGNRKEYALKYKNEKMFKIAINYIDKVDFEEDLKKDIKENIIFNCRKLEMARKFLKENGFSLSELTKLEE